MAENDQLMSNVGARAHADTENQTPGTVIKDVSKRTQTLNFELKSICRSRPDVGPERLPEDPDEWFCLEQAKTAARYQKMLAEQARQAAKALSFDSPRKRNPKVKGVLEPQYGGRRGDHGTDTDDQGYDTMEDTADGYESSSDEGDNDRRYHFNYRPNAIVRKANANADDDLTKPYRPAAFVEKSKFVPKVALAPLPKRYKLPNSIGKYDGLRDPDDHLHDFQTAGSAVDWPMPVWCNLFVHTLTGAARVWFDNLPTGSIVDFNDLLRKFSLHFSQQKKHSKDKAHILLCQRQETEFVEDFILRYNKKALQIGCGEDAGFLHGVRSDELLRCLTGKDGIPESWEGVIRAAKIFAASEKSFRQTHNPDNSNNRKGNQSVWYGSSNEGKYSSSQDAQLHKQQAVLWSA